MQIKPEPPDLVEVQALVTAERLRLMHHGLLNIGGSVLPGLIGLILVPVMLKGLGAELYGLWVMIIAVTGSCAAIADCGISWSVIQEVAASGGDHGPGGGAERLVGAAANFYLLLAITGAAFIAGLSPAVNRFMPLPLHNVENLSAVFTLAAAGFIAGQMFNFQIVVLQGLRRFDLSNLLSVSSALLSGVGIIVLIHFRGGLLGVMEVQAASSALCALAGYKLVIALRPRFRHGLGRFDWALLRSKLAFSMGMQLTTLFNVVTWEAAPLLIGLILGPAWVSSYHIGRKFPAALGALLWPVAVVMFPAASEHQHAGDLTLAAGVLEAGTRWLALLAVPISVVLWIVAPDLLQAWLGRVPSDVVPIFRLVTAAVLVHAFSMTAIGVLMGRGAIDKLLPIGVFEALVVTALTALLLPRVGVRGAAWGLLLPMPFMATALIVGAARSCGVALGDLARRVSAGQAIPVSACMAVTFLALHACESGRWPGIVLASFAGAMAYAITFYCGGGS